jgi:hypothetical protein
MASPTESAFWFWMRVVIVGATLGILYYLITLAVSRYIVEPLTCQSLANGASCVNSIAISGGVAGILVAAIGLFAGIRIGIIRPLLITLATTLLVWDLASWTAGLFWLEALGWSALLYVISYALFTWITRTVPLIVSLSLMAIILIVARIILIL